MRALPAIVLSLLTALLVPSCSRPGNESGAFATIAPEGWLYGDTLSLGPIRTDSAATGNIVLVVRHSNAYLYSNIWVEMTRPVSDSITAVDTFNVVLADDFGHWQGKGLGLTYQKADTVLKNIMLADSVDIKVRHIMRRDTLEDIEQVGVIYVAAPRR